MTLRYGSCANQYVAKPSGIIHSWAINQIPRRLKLVAISDVAMLKAIDPISHSGLNNGRFSRPLEG